MVEVSGREDLEQLELAFEEEANAFAANKRGWSLKQKRDFKARMTSVRERGFNDLYRNILVAGQSYADADRPREILKPVNMERKALLKDMLIEVNALVLDVTANRAHVPASIVERYDAAYKSLTAVSQSLAPFVKESNSTVEITKELENKFLAKYQSIITLVSEMQKSFASVLGKAQRLSQVLDAHENMKKSQTERAIVEGLDHISASTSLSTDQQQRRHMARKLRAAATLPYA